MCDSYPWADQEEWRETPQPKPKRFLTAAPTTANDAGHVLVIAE